MIGLKDLVGHRFVVDSREVKPGDVFVAIKGNRVDGHDFAKQAIDAGAFAVVVERDVGLENQVVVPNTIEFLGQYASKIIGNFKPKIVGITGSNGKTTTKEVVAAILGAEVQTFRNEGNLNSEIGLPLAIINSYKGEPLLVLEMAQRVVGDIEYLCKLFPPDIGVLLNVGSAHVGVAGSLEKIFKGKWQIVENSKQSLVNYDDERMRCDKCRYFGTTGGDYVLKDKKFDGENTILTFETSEGEFYYSLKGYWTKAMALSILVAFGVSDMLDIFFNPTALYGFKPLKGRFNVHHYQNGYLIDDTYNASYESFKIAIEELVESFPRPIYAVVGAMKELGEFSKQYHEMLSKLLENLDGVVVYDKEEESKDIQPSNLMFRSADFDEIVKFIEDKVISNEFSGTLYFKASRAVELDKVVESILRRQ
ncbi:UDP-N-acetylmuramoyl-tripeptide--D-alanyl-D-alanine ligase [Fervidobacterium gondwanense]|uniref:UDP-N-acetylmuramoyl-tripeptide--D-alanyl-D- alanine ligase n=1 Tax=Fervidobacterium gondwanense TaxID=44754 RepID=UPI003C77AA20